MVHTTLKWSSFKNFPDGVSRLIGTIRTPSTNINK